MTTSHEPRIRTGILLGIVTVLFWSCTGAAVSWCGKRLGTWEFITLACGIGGVVQLACYRIMGRSLRSLLAPPPRLWLIILLGFPVYQFTYVAALVFASGQAQTIGVNLINYLWPTLTVVCACLWVPGTKWSPKLVVAVVVALAGLAAGNWREIGEALGSAGGGPSLPPLPYLLVFVAAVAWAVYSSLLSRWREWADRYSTATTGFLLVSIMSAIICTAKGEWIAIDGKTLVAVLLAGAAPFGVGYMLWELALHRAPAEKLGLLGGATPVLSTLVLYLLFAVAGGDFVGGKPPTGADYVRQTVAAVLVASAVLISLIPARSKPEISA